MSKLPLAACDLRATVPIRLSGVPATGVTLAALDSALVPAALVALTVQV